MPLGNSSQRPPIRTVCSDAYVKKFISNTEPKPRLTSKKETIHEYLFSKETPRKIKKEGYYNKLGQILGIENRITCEAISSPLSKRALALIRANPEFNVRRYKAPSVIKKEAESVQDRSNASNNISKHSSNNSCNHETKTSFQDAEDAAEYYDALSKCIRKSKEEKLIEFRNETIKRAAKIKKKFKKKQRDEKENRNRLLLKTKRDQFSQKVNKQNMERLRQQKEREQMIHQLQIIENHLSSNSVIVPNLDLKGIQTNETNCSNLSPGEKYSHIPVPTVQDEMPEPSSHHSDLEFTRKTGSSISSTSRTITSTVTAGSIKSFISHASSQKTAGTARNSNTEFQQQALCNPKHLDKKETESERGLNKAEKLDFTHYQDREQVESVSESSEEFISENPDNIFEMNEEMLRRQKKRIECQKYLDELREQYSQRIKEQNIELPPLCSCKVTDPFDILSKKCCNNCPFYSNPELYVRQLGSLLSSIVS